ncbi:MAG TPA: peroxiredoxin [Candidatus Sulfotelmatobacter sp.]|nr:peroxiredoxin [Candidatus Sulfotelmatobacter sp.]
MREFRALHEHFRAAGATIAGVTTDSIESCRDWAARLQLPYPLLSDERRLAGREFHVMRELGIGGWKIDLFRRTTFLADRHGVVRAIWTRVGVRRHGREVLKFVRTLEAARLTGAMEPPPDSPRAPGAPSAPPA